MAEYTDPPAVDLVGAFTRLQSLSLTTPRVQEFLSELAAVTPQLGRRHLSCSITLGGEGQPYTVTASDDLAAGVDEAQYAENEGPCLEALRDGHAVHVADLRDDSRWPLYRRRAVGLGVRSSFSLPLQVDEHVIGALNLSSRQPHAFDDQLRHSFSVFASQAASALTMVLRRARQDEISAQLEQALASQTVIDQAIGIVMARHRCSADQAFALLRAQSQSTNRKIRDLASDLIERTTGHPPAPRSPFNR